MNLDGHLLELARNDGQFRFVMGIRKLGDAPWLELTHPEFEKQRAHRSELLAARHSELVGHINEPEVLAASQELLATIEAELTATGIERAAVPDDLHPIDEAGRLVREDLLIHTVVDGELVLSAGSVCFPTQWALNDKLGLPLGAIHAPVPTFSSELERPVDRFMSQIRVGASVYRHNFSIVDDPKLCLSPQPFLPVRTINELWLRGERQTLRRLPESGAVVFTIGVDVEPMSSLADPQRRPAAAALLKVVQNMPEEILAYKGLDPSRCDCLVDWLARIIRGQPPIDHIT
jgi:hypothetical protein